MGMDQMMRQLYGRSEGATPVSIAPDIEAVRLRDALALWEARPDLAQGNLVRHKRGLMSDQTISQNCPTGLFIVMAVFGPQLLVQEAKDYPENSVVLGYYDGDGDFSMRATDARYLEQVPEEELTYDK